MVILKTKQRTENASSIRVALKRRFQWYKNPFKSILNSYHIKPAIPLDAPFVEKFLQQYKINLAIILGTNAHGMSCNTCMCAECPFAFVPNGKPECRSKLGNVIGNAFLRDHVAGTFKGLHSTVFYNSDDAVETITSSLANGLCLNEPSPELKQSVKEAVLADDFIADSITEIQAYYTDSSVSLLQHA
jgi:hypothetical protein